MSQRGIIPRLIRILTVLFPLLILAILFCVSLGATRIPFPVVAKVLFFKIPWLGRRLISPDWSPAIEVIVFQIRFPRLFLGILVGASLSVAGVVFQGLLRNPLADPYILGISAGAALGALLSLSLGITNILSLYALPLVAFMGAISTVILVYNLARVDGRIPIQILLLSGVIVGSFLSAVMMFMMFLSLPERLHNILGWMMGNLEVYDSSVLPIAFFYIAAGIGGLWIFARELNIMVLGEETAIQLGVELERLKKILLGLASLITAVGVSLSGLIGFVGLMIPHVMRLIIGPDHRLLIPASALTGSIFLIATDTLARTILSPNEIPVGVITAMLGGPFFIYLLRKKRKAVGSK